MRQRAQSGVNLDGNTKVGREARRMRRLSYNELVAQAALRMIGDQKGITMSVAIRAISGLGGPLRV